jgi:hypothetical protein
LAAGAAAVPASQQLASGLSPLESRLLTLPLPAALVPALAPLALASLALAPLALASLALAPPARAVLVLGVVEQGVRLG